MLKWISVALIACTWLFSAVAFGQLPERIATHWNVSGQVDRTDHRAVGAFIIPFLMLLLWVLARRMPRLDSRAANHERFRETYELMLASMLAFLALVHVAIVGGALGWAVSVPRVLPIGVGALLVIMGNVLPRLRPNGYIGIRTPWTLSSDRVWERTHRVGGAVLTIAGVVIALAFFAEGILAFNLMVGCLVAAAIGVIGYSYIAWREETSH
ncbi:MAG: SdpI family protein [Gemmatimonadaceae bacterium]